MTHHSHRSDLHLGETIMGAIKNNPEGLLLLAAGCALLMRRGGSSLTNKNDEYRGSQALQQFQGARATQSGFTEKVSEGADRAKRYIAEVGDTVSETAKDYATTVGRYAEDAGRTVAEQSERMVEQARSTVEGTFSRILQDQPLGVAVLGFAAGAAVASILPKTSIEQQTFGAVGERISDAATSVRQNLAEAVSSAGDRLTQVAEERGLTADGLKEAAEEVAGAFGGALRGDEKEGRKQESASSIGQSSGGQISASDREQASRFGKPTGGSATTTRGAQTGEPKGPR
jgi:hypothetical protein